MTNKPYVKKFDGNGTLLNPITKEKPYLHTNRTTSSQKADFKYIMVRNAVSGEFVGKVKRGGNNRKPCKRTGEKRSIKFAN